jgi:hypothetical protein
MHLSFNPFVGLLGDALFLLNESYVAQVPHVKFALARSSTCHSLGALHAAGNALLYYEEARDWMTGSLPRKFDRVFELKGLEALPESELEILQELDRVEAVLRNPQPVVAQTHPASEHPNRVEFDRTPLKLFNKECESWPPEYAACVLALALRFLNRLFEEHLMYEPSRTEVTLGNHVSKETSYGSYLDPARLEQIRVERMRLLANDRLMETLGTDRWLVLPEFFGIDFLSPVP